MKYISKPFTLFRTARKYGLCLRLCTIALLLHASTARGAEAPEALWEQANTAYKNANYVGATEAYEAIRAQGLESDRLYLNMGNAYFKRGINGQAILNYQRALRLSPSDEDILYNLAIANTFVQDRIDTVPTFFLKRWMVALYHSFTSDTWAGLSLFVFALMLAFALLYLLVGRLGWRKTGFYGGLVGLSLFTATLIFAAMLRREQLHPYEAIVMSGAVPIKSSPDPASKDIFVLHEGTKVQLKDSLGSYCEILLSDGNKGWVLSSAIEKID